MFRFSIREMMLVTLVLGLALAWWSAARTHAMRTAKLQEENKELTWRTKTLIRGFGDIGFDAYFDETQELVVLEKDKVGGWGPAGRIAHSYDRPASSPPGVHRRDGTVFFQEP
jgi:hypothetical protein